MTHDVDEAIFLSDRIYVMSPRPGHMKLIERSGLPRPRTLDMVTSNAFVELKGRLLASVRDGNREEGGGLAHEHR